MERRVSVLTDGAEKICRRLLAAGYECYLVGGSVRDRLLGRPEADLDLTTNARPADVLRIFPGSHYPNRFGTVLVDLARHQYEVTTYRGEGRYSDHRHPDEIAFVDRLEDDLQRRDFTINAMAMDAAGAIIDPFDGRADLARRLIRAVGDPAERLAEDPLRMMRAVRLATQLGFRIERRTEAAIRADAPLLAMISRERVRDELLKLLSARNPARGIEMLRRLDLIAVVLPSLAAEATYAHALRSLRRTRGDPLLRLAALLHGLEDAEGPALTPGAGRAALTPGPSPKAGQGEIRPFPLSLAGEGEGEGEIQQAAGGEERALIPDPSHNPVRRETERRALRRELEGLRLSNADRQRVERLIEAIPLVPAHLPATPAAARRLLSACGSQLPDVLRLVEAHRLGRGDSRASANLAQLRQLRRLAAAARRRGDPLSAGDLAVTGDDLIRGLGLPPGPRIGALLRLLLDRVLEDPSLNDRGVLLRLAADL